MGVDSLPFRRDTAAGPSSRSQVRPSTTLLDCPCVEPIRHPRPTCKVNSLGVERNSTPTPGPAYKYIMISSQRASWD